MKATKLLAILAMMWVSSSALAVCPMQQTKIFFLNGIDTNKRGPNGAEAARDRLGEELMKAGTNPECVVMDLAYNTNETLFIDWFESALQKADEVGAGVTGFLSSFLRAIPIVPEWFAELSDLLMQAAVDAIRAGEYVSDGQLEDHLVAYRKEINERGKQVILVAHSQGNFYMNQAWDRLSFDEQANMRLVGVSLPTVSVADGGPYTTLLNDALATTFFVPFLGAPLPNVVNEEVCPVGSLSEALAFFCHGFKTSYMHGTNSRTKIVNDIVALLPRVQIGGALCTPNDTGARGFGIKYNEETISRAGFKYEAPSSFSIASLQMRLARNVGAPDTRYRMKVYDMGSDSNPESGTLLSTSPWYGSSNLSTSFVNTTVEVAWGVERGHTYYGIMEDEAGWTIDNTMFMETCSGGSSVPRPIFMNTATSWLVTAGGIYALYSSPAAGSTTIYHGPTTGTIYSRYDLASNSFKSPYCNYFGNTQEGACQGGGNLTVTVNSPTPFSRVGIWTTGHQAGSNQMRMCLSPDCSSGVLALSAVTTFGAVPGAGSGELNDTNVTHVVYTFPAGSTLPVGNVYFIPTTNEINAFTVYNDMGESIPVWNIISDR